MSAEAADVPLTARNRTFKRAASFAGGFNWALGRVRMPGNNKSRKAGFG